MAQTDSQRSDSEDPESSNSPSDLPDSQIGGTVVEKGPLSEDESFQSSVGEMLDSIDAESAEGEISGGGDGDTIGAESVHPSDELLIRAGNILNGGDIPEPEEAAEIAEDEDADGLIDFPDPQSLLAEVDDQDQGLKEEGPDNADYDDGLLLDDDAGDDLFLDSEDGFSISGEDDDIDGVAAGFGGGSVDSSRAKSGRLSQIRKYITWSVAASLAFVGLSILGASFKDPILDLLAHGNIRETRIHRLVSKMTDEFFSSVKPGRPYDLAWIESEIQRVSDTEYWVAVKIGVRLEEDLYSPLGDSYVYSLLPFSKAELEGATAFADDSLVNWQRISNCLALDGSDCTESMARKERYSTSMPTTESLLTVTKRAVGNCQIFESTVATMGWLGHRCCRNRNSRTDRLKSMRWSLPII